jgi:hypothetical protein
MPPRRIALLALLVTSASGIAEAQLRPASARSSLFANIPSLMAYESSLVQSPGSRYGNAALQVLGGTLGSVVGVAIGLAATDDCTGEDDVVCALQSLSITGALGAVGATAGVTVAGRPAVERPSVLGSFLGAAVGTVAGIGLHHLITEEMDQRLNKAGSFALFTISQGTFAALGGRIGAMMGGQ